MLFFSRFFLLQKDFEIQKTKTIFYVSSESKSFFFDACSHERRRRRRRRQKRTRPAKNHLSSFRGGGGGGQKAASPSRLRIENSPPFLRRHRVGIHTQKKGRRRYLCDHFDSKDTHTTTRETDCSSHITCVFRGVWDDEEVARPRKAEAWVCDTADDLKDAALVCMTLSLLCRLRDVRVFCAEEERDFFRSTYSLKSSHVPCVLYFYSGLFCLSLSFFLSFCLEESRAVSLSLSLSRERIFVCEKEREFFLLFFDYGLRKREIERERERERDSIIIFFFFFVDAFETHFCLVVFPERSFDCFVLFAVAKPRLRRSKKDHHLYLVEKEEEEKRRRKREVSNKIVLFSRERRIDYYPHARTRRTGNEEESTARVDVVAVGFRAVFFERFKRRSGDDGVA